MDRLPVELLHRIGRYLLQDSCFRLARTCRHLYHAVLPVMYSDIFMRSTILTAKNLSCFLQTIARKPYLAHSVRIFSIEGWDTNENRVAQFEDEVILDEELIGRLVREASETDEEMTRWLHSLRKGNPDAWLALLMPLLTNLRKLEVEYPYFPKYFNSMLDKAAQGKVKAFPRLEEVETSWADTELGIDSNDLLPYFYFPAMRKLQATNVVEREGNSENGGFDNAQQSFSGIKELVLESSNGADGMTRWLRCCKALKSFSIDHGGALVSEDSWMSAVFGKSLARHKSTLEYLSLDINDSNDVDEEQWVGSLTEYLALKYLHIRYPDLVGMSEDWEPLHEISDLLPSSLETLSLEGCGDDVLHWLPAQLERLIQSGQTPNLTTLSLEGFNVMSREDCQPELRRLFDICEQAGIRLQ
ncbi:hypothetical protein BDV12DRAFT_204792 [Aspergillus spectabilis]